MRDGGTAGTPSFSTSSTAAPPDTRSRNVQLAASECRSTLVAASRTTQPSTDCASAGSASAPDSSVRQSTFAARSTEAAPISSVCSSTVR